MLTVEFDRLPLEPGARILDLGCGDGRHARETRRLPGVSTYAMDIGEGETSRTTNTLEEMDKTPEAMGGVSSDAGPWTVVRGSAYELPFADSSLDCVIFSEVLEHLHEDRAALAEVHRVLKPGGTLALSVPREGPEAVCWALSSEYRNSPGGHVRIYRRNKLRQLLQDSGYEVVASHFAHGLHSPYWWLKCLVGPSREGIWPIDLYHRLLVWDLMKKPFITQVMENALSPFIGKSVVFYAVRA